MKAIFSILFCLCISSFVLNARTDTPNFLSDAYFELKSPGQSVYKELAYVEGGTFTMMKSESLKPSSQVDISSFYMQKYEVTNHWYKCFIYDLAKKDMEAALKMIPDTGSWVKDFKYSYNEPMKLLYFKHVAYDNYPVVGVNYYQAKEFAKWANEKLQEYLQSQNIKHIPLELRLPTEAEWQYAASGGLDKSYYGLKPTVDNISSAGNMMLYDVNKKKYRANFKTDEGYFIGDGAFHTAKVGSYSPNAYGLYDMVGNISEWTSDRFLMADNAEDLRSNNGSSNENIYTVKGGSWKDGFAEQQITRSVSMSSDSAHCYVGFRLVASVKN